MKQEFDHAFSGKPEAVKKHGERVLHGYRIADINGSAFVTSTIVYLNKWRTIDVEDKFWYVILEKITPIIETRTILYKSRETADEHLKTIK